MGPEHKEYKERNPSIKREPEGRCSKSKKYINYYRESSFLDRKPRKNGQGSKARRLEILTKIQGLHKNQNGPKKHV